MHKIIRSTFYALLILIPLIFTTWNYELFEFPKYIILISGTIIVGTAWIFDNIKNQVWKLPKSPFNIPILAFLASQILSTIFSIHPYTSFFGYYSRFHQGLLTTICYTILYFAYIIYMDKKSTLKLIKISVATAFAISIYAILEHFGVDKNLWVQDVQNRVFSTLGQPNWLAAYLLPNIFLAHYLHSKYSKKSFIYIPLFITFYITLLFTKSRSGILAFTFSYTLYWSLVLLKQRKQILKNAIAYLASVLFFTLFIGSPWTPKITELFSIKQAETPIPNTVIAPSGTQLELGGSSSTQIRQIVWTGAWEIAKQFPILGTGVETFAYSYYWKRPVDHNYVTEWDFLYNKAHNEYLNLAATSGFLGLGTHLALYLFLCYYLVQELYLDRSSKIDSILGISIGASLVSIGITNFFGFSVIPVALFFYLLPAILLSKKDQKTSKYINPGWGFVIVTIILLVFPARMYLADYYFSKGKNARSLDEGVNYLQKSIKLRSHQALYYSELAEQLSTYTAAYANSIGTNPTDIQLNQLNQLESETLVAIDKNRELNPVHLNFYKSRAKSYINLSALRYEEYHQAAAKEIEKGIELSPTDAKLYYNLGLMYTRLSRNDEAIQALKKSIELKNNYEQPYYALLLIFEETKQVNEIAPLLEKATSNLPIIGPDLQAKIDIYLD